MVGRIGLGVHELYLYGFVGFAAAYQSIQFDVGHQYGTGLWHRFGAYRIRRKRTYAAIILFGSGGDFRDYYLEFGFENAREKQKRFVREAPLKQILGNFCQ